MITRPSTIRHNNATHSPTHQPTPRTHLPHPQPSSVQHVFDETAKYRYDMVLYSTAVQMTQARLNTKRCCMYDNSRSPSWELVPDLYTKPPTLTQPIKAPNHTHTVSTAGDGWWCPWFKKGRRVIYKQPASRTLTELYMEKKGEQMREYNEKRSAKNRGVPSTPSARRVYASRSFADHTKKHA